MPEKRTIARLKVWYWAFILTRWAPVATRPLLQNFSFFFRYRHLAAVPHFVRPAAQGLVVTTEYYWDLLRKNLLCKCMGLVFAMGQDFLRKLGLAKNWNLEKKIIFFVQKKLIFLSFGDIFTFSNSCAIAKELLKKTVLENMGYWQNGSENEKVCCHKVTLCLLGLT